MKWKKKIDNQEMYIGDNLTSLLLRITFERMEVCEAVKTFFCEDASIATKMVKVAKVDNNLIGNGQNGLAFKLLVDFYNASQKDTTFNSFKTKIAERKSYIEKNINRSSPAIKAPEQLRPLKSRGSSSNRSSSNNIKNLESQKRLQEHGFSKGLFGNISIGGKKKTRKVKKSKNKKKSRKAVKKNKKRTLKKRTLKKRR